MVRSRSPPPSKAAERLREYLDIVKLAEVERGKALWYDIYRRAGNQYQTDSMIQYLQDNGLVDGNKEDGFHLTEKGQTWHDILKRHRDLVGVLTRELSGDRRKEW
ncbi:winged helix-turn-helix domain-containing protein [Methanocella sp. MCL-LM]|uniref:winged helix-turn-helix domain-containing protein n=1 Tax=Methanocella sp. MCL-LM TaxID=3412035 RepID=UPI003C790081